VTQKHDYADNSQLNSNHFNIREISIFSHLCTSQTQVQVYAVETVLPKDKIVDYQIFIAGLSWVVNSNLVKNTIPLEKSVAVSKA
jgi:hypothetical protein